MKNRKYRLLSMGGFEMLDKWLSTFYEENVPAIFHLFTQFVKYSCNIDIGITKKRVYFYDKINGNQYFIQRQYIVRLAINEVFGIKEPSKCLIESIYMDRKNNRKWINAQNLVKRY